MAKPQNRYTSTIRNAVTNWIARTNPDSFTVPVLITALSSSLEGCYDIDISKALSNELTRRTKLGLLVVEGVEVVGLGRPPKVYRQKWRI